MLRRDPRPEFDGRPVICSDGERAGTVARVHGEFRGWPEQVVIELEGDHEGRMIAVPAAGALLSRHSLLVPWPAHRLVSAPPLDRGAQDDAAAVGRAVAAFVDPGTRPIADDPDAMTISEERLVVSTRPVETERVRLRKRIVEREVMVPVTLRHEELEIVREPVTDLPAEPGTEVTEGVAAEVVLHAERPVIGRSTVPVERVRLVKSYVQEEITVEGEVRREEVEVDRLPPAPVAP